MHPHVLYIDCTSIVLRGCFYKWAVRKCSSVCSARRSTETRIVLMVDGPDLWTIVSFLASVVLEVVLKLVLYLWLVVLTCGLLS